MVMMMVMVMVMMRRRMSGKRSTAQPRREVPGREF